MIWQIESPLLLNDDGSSEHAAKLWKSSEQGKYLVTQAGYLAPVLSCGHFVLINDDLYRFLSRHITTGAYYEPAWIEDRVKQTCTEGYRRFTCDHTFDIPDNSCFDTEGIAIWLVNDQYIFISDELKLLFENNPVKGTYLSQGFSLFAN